MLNAAIRNARLPSRTRAIVMAPKLPAASSAFLSARMQSRMPLMASSRDGFDSKIARVSARWLSSDAKDTKVDAADVQDASIVDQDKLAEEAEAQAGVEGTKGTERVVGSEEQMGFKAETRQLLDIVTHSLYSDKEVFVRELVSNASDALEKARHASLVQGSNVAADTLEVRISVDPVGKLFAIQDTGIGMTRAEMAENLGTIAKSGSKAFVNEMSGKAAADSPAAASEAVSSIIGKFGVGFYASFMVAERVTVYSRKRGEATGHCWRSAGDGTFSLAEAEGVEFGTKVVLELRDDGKDFADVSKVKDIVKKHSSFVSFPVTCNGTRVNEVSALWMKNEKDITPEEHTALYRHIASQYDDPLFHLVFKADVPLDIKSVFYIPAMNSERFGMRQLPPGVHLYCRRVLIQRNAPDLLPSYLSWISGVVDSEDLPLSISRESMQDQRKMANLKSVVTKRIIKWLTDEAKRVPDDYKDFYGQFGYKIKEGVASDRLNAASLAALLRYPSSATTDTEPAALEQYVAQMPEGQDTIYYLVAGDRRVAEASPYYEAFKRAGLEVLFCYHEHDEVVLGNLGKFRDIPLKSIEEVEPPAKFMEKSEGEDKDKEGAKGEEGEGKSDVNATVEMGETEGQDLMNWLKETLGARCTDVEATGRLVDSPAIVSEHDNAMTRRMMQMEEFKALGVNRQASYKLQVNLKHPLLRQLSEARSRDEAIAKVVAEQLLDNAILSAGILDGARDMVPRLTKLMEIAMGSK